MSPSTLQQTDGTQDGLSFPRLQARTARFTLGEPRNVTVAADGSTVLFVRTASGTDRTGALWAFDVATSAERILADPVVLLGPSGEELSDAEKARRERARESGAGIVGYAVDKRGATAVFALSGALWVCDVASGTCRTLPATGTVIDPRIDPTGRRIAYASDSALRVINIDGTGDLALAEPHRADPDEAEVVWGQAEFVAAEEMDRFRGYWWAPDGESLLVERYDNAPVGVWHIADPANPAQPPVQHRYPAAGTANANVSLWHVTLGGVRRQVSWDEDEFPYLARVSWTGGGAVVQVLSRDQRHAQVLDVALPTTEQYAADPTLRPVCSVVHEAHDPAWIDLVTGLPARTSDGRLLTSGIDHGADTYRLLLNGEPITPPGMQVRAVLNIGDSGVLTTVSTEPTQQQLVLIGYDGAVRVLSNGPGTHTGAIGGPTVVVASARLNRTATEFTVQSLEAEAGTIGTLLNHVMPAPFTPRVHLMMLGDHSLRTALVLPQDHQPGSRRLPVIMSPYGGPHAQLVRASGRLFLQAQWLADQGFAVVVADGRGTPARGPAWERAVKDELAAVTLADQVEALAAVCDRYPEDLDPDRVGIMGWSYGGYLSALAVLDRPDVFHAAVAGAPVTDWALYDTCYTERYLGDPNDQPKVYARNSLIERAPNLVRPLLLIHGLADDNVVVAHTLRLSGALLAAGRAHEVLPLTGITHMASDEVVAENLLLAQVEFFRKALGA